MARMNSQQINRQINTQVRDLVKQAMLLTQLRRLRAEVDAMENLLKQK